MRSFRPLHASLLLAGAAIAAAVPAMAGAQALVQPLPGTTDADRLADAIRRVGANPRDLYALVDAGELSIKVGDTTAAAALFKRAEAIDPHNARVKAGIARIMVNGEHPGEALRYFNLAQQYGLQPAAYADDRGLAYDLIGQQDRAQRDYRLALRTQDNDEVRRRYALSLGISGHKDEALEEIDTLLRKGDRGAWRARAFILAMNGDAAGANKIATTMMPPGMAPGLAAFFSRLPTLSATDRAFAVHFGEVTPTPSRLADARMVPPLPTLGPDPFAPRPKPVQVAAVRKESAGERRRRERDEKRAQQVAARESARTKKAADKAAERAARDAAKAKPVRVASATLPPKAASSPTGVPSPVTAGAIRPTLPTPAVSATAVPATTTARPTVAPPTQVALMTTPPLSSTATPQIVSPTSAPTSATIGQQLAPNGTRPAVTAPPVVPPVTPTRIAPRSGVSPVREASGVQTAPAQLAAATPTVSAPARITTPTVTSYPPASPSTVAPAQIASTTTPRRADPPPPTRAPQMVDDSILARIVANIAIPASELGVAAPASRPPATTPSATQTLDEAAALAERNAAAEEARKQRAADRKAAADAKTAAAKKLADAKALADKKAAAAKAAEEKKAARAEPARVWVQVAGGANEGDLQRAWKDAQGKSASLKTRKGYSTPLRATNRVVTGPFKTTAEAQAFVNKLRGEGVSAFTFTSSAGQKVSRLGEGK